MGPVGASVTPLRPAMAFQIGITGHRALPDADVDALRTAAARLFRAVRDEVLRLHASDQASAIPLYQPVAPALRCVCGLAEGADGILAEAALAEGWTLVAALPFAREEFERDFTPGPALDRFRALLARTATVSELDGDRRRGSEPYAEIGQQVVEQSDLLLAVWDGLPPRGPGGTGDVVGRALERGVPVAILPPSGSTEVEWRGVEASAAAGAAEAGIAACPMPALVRLVLLPPADPGGFPQACFRDAPPGAGWAGAAVRAYERILLTGARPEAATADVPAPAGPTTPARVAAAAPTRAGAASNSVQSADGSLIVAASEARLLPFFQAPDRLATEYAARYRAAGLLRYGLILPATLGALIGFFGEPWSRPGGFLLQFASLAAIVAFSARGGWEQWHRRFVAYRAVAEYLRNSRLLAPLGAVAQAPGAAMHQGRDLDWTAWYGRAAIRSVGLLPVRIGPAAAAAVAAFLRKEAAGEVAYLLGRASRYSAIATRLRRIGVALFMCGIGFAALRAALLLADAGARTMLWVGGLGLLLPALAPVFLGLLGFGEYSRLSTRYCALAGELQALIAKLDRAEPNRAAVLGIGRRIADTMLAEGADWQLLIKARDGVGVLMRTRMPCRRPAHALLR